MNNPVTTAIPVKQKIHLIFSGLIKAHLHLYRLAEQDMLEQSTGAFLAYPYSTLAINKDTVITIAKHESNTARHTRLSYSLIADQLGVKKATLNHYITGRSAPPVESFSRLLDILGLTFGDLCALWLKSDDELECWWDWFRHESLWRYQLPGIRPANKWQGLLTAVNRRDLVRQRGWRNRSLAMTSLIKAAMAMTYPDSWQGVADFFFAHSPTTTPDASHSITGRPWETATHAQAENDFNYELKKLGGRS